MYSVDCFRSGDSDPRGLVEFALCENGILGFSVWTHLYSFGFLVSGRKEMGISTSGPAFGNLGHCEHLADSEDELSSFRVFYGFFAAFLGDTVAMA